MIAAVALLLLTQIVPPGFEGQKIRDWKYQRLEPNARTGRNEIALRLQGAEAVPLDLTKDKEIVELRGVRALYYTSPRKPDETSEEISIDADRARMDNRIGTIVFSDRVRVSRPNKDRAPTVLTTSNATARFRRVLGCTKCEVVSDAPGRCPVHGGDFRETTKTVVETDRDFSVAGPDGVLTGVGLLADDALRAMTVARDGFLEFAGEPPRGPADARTAAVDRAQFVQLHSRGPMVVRELGGLQPVTELDARGGVRVDRLGPDGTTTLLADRARVEMARVEDAAGGPSRPEPRRIDAEGDVAVSGTTFADGEALACTADRLQWEHAGDQESTLLVGAPIARCRIGANAVAARRISLKDPEGNALFEGDVDASIADAKRGGPPIRLASERLAVRMSPLGTRPRAMRTTEATGRVILLGLMDAGRAGSPDGAPPGRAEADRFVWDAAEERGLLEARPFVRIVQGENLILAPLVILESPEVFVLKGPKSVRLAQTRDGARETYAATSEGDIVVDKTAGVIRMRRDCVLRTPEISMTADRVDVRLGADGKDVEELRATGAVRAFRPREGAALFGDLLVFRPARQEIRLDGRPFAVAETGRTTVRQERILRYEGVHPITGKKVMFTESIGGEAGVRIVIDEKPR